MSAVYYVTLFLVFVLAYLAQERGEVTGALIKLEDGNTRHRPDRLFVILASLVLIFVAGCRYYVGTDFGYYYKDIVGGFSAFWRHLWAYKEPGIWLVGAVGRLFADNGGSVIFMASLFTVGLYMIQIYKHANMYLVSMLLFMFLGTWDGSFNGVRQYMAAAVLFAGHRFILERKFIKYLIVVFLASLCHTSALIMIPVYFIFLRKLDGWQLLIMAVGAVAIRFSYDLVFSAVGFLKGQEVVMNDYSTNSVNILRIIVNMVPVGVYLLFCEKKNLTREESFYLTGIILNGFVYVATMQSTYLARAGIYTDSFAILGYGYLFKLIKNEKTRTFLMIAAMVLFFVYWRYAIVHSTALNDFKWIWEAGA
ncbi:MAG TPA: EpsG family protein [Eubacteriales bacterium]|nr:EpsG family protein [Clostridia bacterium]HRV73466.1 EpsG family protein [Eubacteriales bacterium]